MLDADFFRDVLPSEIARKMKDNAEGVVTVEIRLHGGGQYTVASWAVTDTALLLDVYPEKGPATRIPAPERKAGAPLADLDRVALAYSAIRRVIITTRRARKDIRFRVD
jgi:hypothetical protein